MSRYVDDLAVLYSIIGRNAIELTAFAVPMIHKSVRGDSLYNVGLEVVDRHEEIFTKASNVQRPIKLKKSNRNQKKTEGRLTAAPSRAYYYNILGNMKVPLEEYPQTLGNFILIVPNSIQLGMLQDTKTFFITIKCRKKMSRIR